VDVETMVDCVVLQLRNVPRHVDHGHRHHASGQTAAQPLGTSPRRAGCGHEEARLENQLTSRSKRAPMGGGAIAPCVARPEGGQLAMSTKQLAVLAQARLAAACGHLGAPSAINGGANGATKVTPGASFTGMWYPAPDRLMSQSERLPS
jgi:hypothetical protein